MSKFSVEFSSSDYIDVVEETTDKIIIQDSEGSIKADRKAAERIFKGLESILYDETFEQLEDKYMKLQVAYDKLKEEVYESNHVREDLDDYDMVANM